MTTADVVVVGGGVIGASIAYHLSLRGAGHVIVLERDRLGTGSTGHNARGIRPQFSTAEDGRLSQRASPPLRALRGEMGAAPALCPRRVPFPLTAGRAAAPHPPPGAAKLRHGPGPGPRSRISAHHGVRPGTVLPPRARGGPSRHGRSGRPAALRRLGELGLPSDRRRARPLALAAPRAGD